MPLLVGVNVHVTTVFSPPSASSPDAFQLQESHSLGSTTRTSQSSRHSNAEQAWRES